MKKIAAVFMGIVISFSTQVVFAQPADASITQDDTLILQIPSVGFSSDPGKYQNIMLQSGETELTWTLLSGDTVDKINTVSTVSVVKTSEVPVQVLLKVGGNIATCVDAGKYAFTINENKIDTFLYYDPATVPPAGTGCVDTVKPFVKVIPLPVYGLDAGEYSFSINGKLNGTFTLTVRNELP
tara:strand:+ start:494 stop:1042 length:549 start_codon:yes stop_codon:yes gene_type:complete